MPEFTPTPYMLEKHKSKGDGVPWKIYAWCVRDAICKHSGIKPLNEPCKFEDKRGFVALMNGKTDKAVINGQIFEYVKGDPKQSIVIRKPAQILRRSTLTFNVQDEVQENQTIREETMNSYRGEVDPDAGVDAGVEVADSEPEFSDTDEEGYTPPDIQVKKME